MMYDTISKVACPDCHTVIDFRFTLLVHGAPTLMSIAGGCPKCGDGRSVRASGAMSRELYIWAADHGLPVIRFN